MMDENISVDDFIKSLFIRRDELATIVGYNVSGNSIRGWLAGKTRPRDGFEEACQAKRQELIQYSEWKLSEGVFENYPKRKPQGFWGIRETHRYALEWLCKKEGWEFPFGLYKAKKDTFLKHNLDGLLPFYSKSVTQTIISVLDEYEWVMWKFQMLPMGYWKDESHRISYLEWFENQMGIIKPEQWYKVSVHDFKNNHGSTLFFTYFKGNMMKTAQALYPTFEFHPWKFRRTPRNEFDMRDHNHLRYMVDTTARELGFGFPEGYYGFMMKKHFGHTRLGKAIRGGMCMVLRELYPDQVWYPWLFAGGVENNFWKDEENIRTYCSWLERELGMKSLDEWYDLNNSIVNHYGGGGLLAHGKGKGLTISQIARIAYPSVDWDPTRFEKKKYKSQKRLFRVLEQIYPEHEILYNSRHPDIRNPKTNYPLELDCYIPSLNLALEFQGIQHTQKSRLFHSDSSRDRYEDLKFRDRIKRERCRELGICLVEISKLNWDFTEKGLISLINRELPPKSSAS